MADFDGEDLMSDDELSQINAHAHFTHLSNMASMYHTHMPHCKYLYEKMSAHNHLLLTLKAPIKTAADDKFCDIFPNFRQK